MLPIHQLTSIKTAIPISIEYDGTYYSGVGIPLSMSCRNGACYELDITLNMRHIGILHCRETGLMMKGITDQDFINAIGSDILRQTAAA